MGPTVNRVCFSSVNWYQYQSGPNWLRASWLLYLDQLVLPPSPLVRPSKIDLEDQLTEANYFIWAHISFTNQKTVLLAVSFNRYKRMRKQSLCERRIMRWSSEWLQMQLCGRIHGIKLRNKYAAQLLQSFSTRGKLNVTDITWFK